MIKFSATTDRITVTATPVFLERESKMAARKFVFVYFITIKNDSDTSVTVLRRHWIITQSTGKKEEVDGEGIVGTQPVIYPGRSHSYNSFCVLETFEGWMEGTYLVERTDGGRSTIAIPRFSLRAMAN